MEIGDSDTDKYPHRIGNISRRIKLHDMRTVTLIIVHCSAVKPDQQSSAAQIDRHRLPLRHPTRRNARNGTTGIYGGGTLSGTQQILDRCVLRGRTRQRRTACRHSHRGTATGSEAATPGTETALSPRPHRRPSRPEPHEGLSLLRCSPRVCWYLTRRKASKCWKLFFLLGYPDSNQERQDQNLQCYHYTIPQTVDAIFELRVQR